MKITVDCNSDKIHIDDIEMKCKYPEQVVKILEEILNLIATDREDEIVLIKIDEEYSTTIGEW